MRLFTGFSIYLRVIGMIAVWGASWPAGRVVAQGMPPVTAAALRFLLASVILLLWLHHARGLGSLKAWSAQRWVAMALAAAVGVFGYAALFLSGLQFVEAGRASMILTLNPVLTLALAAWLFGERINAPIVLGMCAAVLGASMVIAHGSPLSLLADTSAAGPGVGEALIFGCMLCWVGYTLLGRWLLAGVDGLSTLAVTSAMGALMLTAGSFAIEGVQSWTTLGQATAGVWAAMVFLIVGATVLGYAWFFDTMGALGAAAAAGFTTLVPVCGVLLSALLLGERLDGWMLGGGTLAVGGTVLMQMARQRLGRSTSAKKPE